MTGATTGVTLTASDGERLEFGCAPGQSVLDAAAEAGAALPASCRRGTCGSCRAAVTGGPYEHGSCSPQALPPDRRERGEVLLCRTFPGGDRLEAALPYPSSRIIHGGVPEREGVITALETVARETVRLELRVEPDDAAGDGCQFDPGQFMDLRVPGQDYTRAYSLANTGNWEGCLEFFVRLRPGGLFSGWLRDGARVGDRLTVRGPQGAFGLRETGPRPRWFVAGGTGLAPLLSMVRHMAEWQEPQPARLFLGVNEEAEVFGLPELKAVACELPGFSYEICVRRPGPSWPGPPATPVDRVAALLPDAPVPPDLYVCGPPPLVEAVAGAAAAGGLAPERVHHERFLPT
ncbi:2Fe-2S iron-sulfur cluster-binding protein [Streptomyces boncukensis]|uniref:2Fe-2S iron-sulfur cluster binding domain-containing protein n=1 Tax=Streptomyces boncukensis TaxID=2711219 RepID=A0A6G4X4Z7_9ACTN|nr:2Fe-2S iron-sulfur cluster binding domain-containing protein [Streptomyces boncukensis]NGO72468.1 2Fe-2S iron-sulfur cluster binding domain-containing protein [Streptomyces boncukensis]